MTITGASSTAGRPAGRNRVAHRESYIDSAALAAEVDRIALRPLSMPGGRPLFLTETMLRIVVLKRLYKLSDEQMEYPLDRISYKRFCGLNRGVAEEIELNRITVIASWPD